MSFDFDRAIAAPSRGEGIYDTPVEDGWDIRGNANGGYLLALVANAMRIQCARDHPVSVTMHYLSPAPAGPALTRCETVKAGRRLSTVTAALEREGRDIARAIGTFGSIDATAGPSSVTIAPPELPPFTDCIARTVPSEIPMGLMRRLDMRLHPEDTGFARGAPTGRALVRGYFAFADGRDPDPLALLLAADAFPPVMFNLFGVEGWVPTVEFTVHVRALPAPGPIRCQFTSSLSQGGFWEEDGVMWDSTGVCVAMSRQLALAPLAPS